MKDLSKENSKDPVQVYCRLRPLKTLTELACLRRYSDNILKLFHPSGLKNEVYYNFKFVFPENATQKEVFDEIALPLVKDLLNGKDGLLFTYGITSSGKTYTLTGNGNNPGILPRTLDVIFNTINQRQARKFVFESDGQNYFKIRSNADALIEAKSKKNQQKLIDSGSRTPSRRNIRNQNNDDYKDWMTRQKDDSICDLQEDNDNLFAVFVSYFEIYNNYIYDLLDEKFDDQIKMKQPQSKLLREDLRKKIFVLNGVEIEVKSADEATELFIKGINKRRIAHTALNAESSRSHSVFNIKIVQAPRDSDGEVVQDSKFMTVSQLSLVDLAGSERVGRTKNTGDRLREASSINNSLMALRNCIDILRENQRQNQNKKVPYRDNKLTNLFKSYLEGQGSIKMAICVNPSADDYDETIHVMKFAEATQDVMIKRAANIQFAKFDLINFNSLNVNYPSTDFDDVNNEKIFPDWLIALDERKKNNDIKLALFREKSLDFRTELAKMDRSYLLAKTKANQIENDLNVRQQQNNELNRNLAEQQNSINTYKKQINELEFKIRDQENDLTELRRIMLKKNDEINQAKLNYKEKYDQKLQNLKNQFDTKLDEIKHQLERQKYIQREQREGIMKVLENGSSEIFDKRNSIFADVIQSKDNNQNNENLQNKQTGLKKTSQHQSRFEVARGVFEQATTNTESNRQTRKRSADNLTPVANPKHRRSLSKGGEKWIDHQPLGLDLGTVMTPSIKNAKSISNLRKISTSKLINASHYALTHHLSSQNGDVETHVYKGDIIPTSVGGAQIIFNDIEKLQQISPQKDNNRSNVVQSYDIGIENN